MTQWIFETGKCSCSSAATAASQFPRCALCGLAVRTKLGSITYWIFKTPLCECLVTDESAETLTTEALPVNDLIADSPYEFLGVTGSGGIATVYKAKSRKLGRFVAIKILQMGMEDTRAVENFLREAKSASKLQHPNIITMLDFGEMKDGRQFLVTEWIPGITLAQYLEKRGTLTVETIQELFSQVLDGLSHAHNRGVVHRDIKPSNIMLVRGESGGWSVKIIDFGTAKEIDNEGATTRAEDMACSPFYMSPEQATGEKVDARSDLYSVGCSIFESLTGRTPFIGKALSVVMRHQLEEPPTLAQAAGSQFPQYMEDVVAKFLAKTPSLRYQSADQAKIALRTKTNRQPKYVVGGANLSDKAQSGNQTNRVSIGRGGFVFGAVLAMLGCICAVAIVFFMSMKEPSPTKARVSEAEIALGLRSPSIQPAFTREVRNGVMTVLNYSHSQLDDITSGVSHKNGIETIRISYSEIRASELRSLKDMGRLRSIHMTGVEGLNKDAFSAIASIKTLKTLYVQPLTQSVPVGATSGLSTSPLESLTLQYVVSEQDAKDIARMPNLKDLTLGGASDARLLIQLKNIPNLRKLTLNGFTLGEPASESLSSLRQIRELSLRALRMTENALTKMSPMPAVVNLDVSKSTLGDASVQQVCRIFPNLVNLNLGLTAISDAGLSALIKLNSLSNLNIAGTKTTDAALSTFDRLPKLHRIDVSDTNISKDGLIKFMRSHKHSIIFVGSNFGQEEVAELESRAKELLCEITHQRTEAGLSDDRVDFMQIAPIR